MGKQLIAIQCPNSWSPLAEKWLLLILVCKYISIASFLIKSKANDCYVIDPANENMEYTPAADISELIKHEEVMTQFGLGPNGALVYCMEFLEINVKWLITKVLNLKDHYLIFDCPGQVS